MAAVLAADPEGSLFGPPLAPAAKAVEVPGELALEVEAEGDMAPRGPRAARAEDRLPRLLVPSGVGYVRRSLNPDGSF